MLNWDEERKTRTQDFNTLMEEVDNHSRIYVRRTINYKEDVNENDNEEFIRRLLKNGFEYDDELNHYYFSMRLERKYLYNVLHQIKYDDDNDICFFHPYYLKKNQEPIQLQRQSKETTENKKSFIIYRYYRTEVLTWYDRHNKNAIQFLEK